MLLVVYPLLLHLHILVLGLAQEGIEGLLASFEAKSLSYVYRLADRSMSLLSASFPNCSVS